MTRESVAGEIPAREASSRTPEGRTEVDQRANGTAGTAALERAEGSVIRPGVLGGAGGGDEEARAFGRDAQVAGAVDVAGASFDQGRLRSRAEVGGGEHRSGGIAGDESVELLERALQGCGAQRALDFDHERDLVTVRCGHRQAAIHPLLRPTGLAEGWALTCWRRRPSELLQRSVGRVRRPVRPPLGRCRRGRIRLWS